MSHQLFYDSFQLQSTTPEQQQLIGLECAFVSPTILKSGLAREFPGAMTDGWSYVRWPVSRIMRTTTSSPIVFWTEGRQRSPSITTVLRRP